MRETFLQIAFGKLYPGYENALRMPEFEIMEKSPLTIEVIQKIY